MRVRREDAIECAPRKTLLWEDPNGLGTILKEVGVGDVTLGRAGICGLGRCSEGSALGRVHGFFFGCFSDLLSAEARSVWLEEGGEVFADEFFGVPPILKVVCGCVRVV